MRLVQFKDPTGRRGVGAVEDGRAVLRLRDIESVYELALEAVETRRPLVELVRELRTREAIDLEAAEREGRLLPPLEHPVPTRCWVTGTGLTHLGSAEARAEMRGGKAVPEDGLSDAMKLFRLGVERGKPAGGGIGSQSEWFFRGNGATLLASGQPVPLPSFALDGGEEPEIAGLYVIADDGTPCRIGWALGNDYTDHVMERENHLYLAHSKLRPSPLGPELLLGELPADVRGTSRVLRDGGVLWERSFASGEANMTHTFASLEHHHFKYPMFRRPGDVHIHFFGTSTLSFRDGVVPRPGDVFEIASPSFGRPLRNRLERAEWSAPPVRAL
jgi:hypothetical protein